MSRLNSKQVAFAEAIAAALVRQAPLIHENGTAALFAAIAAAARDMNLMPQGAERYFWVAWSVWVGFANAASHVGAANEPSVGVGRLARQRAEEQGWKP